MGMSIAARAGLYTASAGDLLLRTLLASAVTAATFPRGLALDGSAEVRRLEFYAELAERRDPESVFVPPPRPVPVQTRPGVGLSDSGGRIELLRFRSPFEPLHPELRSRYLDHPANAIARAQHWRHDGRSRQTLLVIHGFGASPAWFNAAFFSLREFFEDGWDIVLFTLPFHGGRRGPLSPFNGAELFAGGFAHLCEAMLQAICDLRVVLDHLQRRRAPRVGVTGLSLGGYAAALLAEVDDRLDFAIPNAAVASLPQLIDGWFPANIGTALLEWIKRVPRELIARSAALHSPLSYPPKLPRDRLMVIGGRGDRLAPPEQSVLLWEHWGQPALHWYPGSHMLHFSRSDYLEAMRGLMQTPRRPPEPSDSAAPATRRQRRAGM